MFGPSQQPIALGAALILILPLAVYFARTSGRRWWLAALLILLGALASGSRTAVVMLAARGDRLPLPQAERDEETLAALIPAVAVVHFALPGTIGGLKEAFFPKGGLIAQQSRFEADYNPLLAGGRIRLAQADAERGQREAVLRRRLWNENHRLQYARSKRPDPRRSMAEQCSRRRLRRSRRMGLADRESRS